MKKLLFFLSLAFFACNSTEAEKPSVSTPPPSSSAQATQTKYEPIPSDRELENTDFTVIIKGLQAGGEGTLAGVYGDQNYKAATAPIGAGGTMRFTRDEPLPAGMYFLLLPDNRNLQILLDIDQTFTMTTNTANLVGAMKVDGSKENEILYDNLRYETVYQQKFQAISAEMNRIGQGNAGYLAKEKERKDLVNERKADLQKIFDANPNTLFTSFKRGGQNPDVREIFNPDGSIDNETRTYFYRRDFWEGVNLGDERLLRTPVIGNKLKRYIKEFTVQNQDSIIASAKYLVDKSLPYGEYYKFFANWITMQYDPQETTLMDPQAVYVFMIQNYFTNDRAFWSDSVEVFGLQQRAYEMQASLLGKKAKNVVAPGPDGKTYELYDIDADFTVVYMFNPDCEHCQEETPKLVDFYKEWKSKGVEVFAMAIDTDDAKWKDYINKTGATAWTNIHDPTNRSIYPNWFVDVTPEIYVLDKNKVFIGKNLKVNQIETIINRHR